MKILAIMLMATLFVSCADQASTPVPGPGVSKSLVMETNVPFQEPILRPRYGCKGERLQHPKVIGWNQVNLPVAEVTNCGFSDSELAAAGYTYTGEVQAPIVSDGPYYTYPDSPYPNKDISPKVSEGLFWFLVWSTFLMLLALVVALWMQWYQQRRIADRPVAPAPPAQPVGMVSVPVGGYYFPPVTPGRKRKIIIDEFPEAPAPPPPAGEKTA